MYFLDFWVLINFTSANALLCQGIISGSYRQTVLVPTLLPEVVPNSSVYYCRAGYCSDCCKWRRCLRAKPFRTDLKVCPHILYFWPNSVHIEKVDSFNQNEINHLSAHNLRRFLLVVDSVIKLFHCLSIQISSWNTLWHIRILWTTLESLMIQTW